MIIIIIIFIIIIIIILLVLVLLLLLFFIIINIKLHVLQYYIIKNCPQKDTINASNNHNITITPVKDTNKTSCVR